MLNKQLSQILLSLARQTIEERLGVPPSSPIQPGILHDPALNRKQAVFVTLIKSGQLRGCVGSLTAEDTIIVGLKKNSINAAFHDSRFPPLDREELNNLKIEISLLSEPQPLAYKNDKELINKLRPAIDGVIIKANNGAGATFLPQVWDQLPNPVVFLNHLCQKAGLAESVWQTGQLDIRIYQVQKLTENE
jgi:AmmeMemoRadiSam system protein A